MRYDVYINIGGTLIDTDAQTKIGFAYNSRWLLNEDAGKYRTFDLSVPATKTNNKVFSFYEEPAAAGVRQSMKAIIMSGGVSLEGKLYVTNHGGGRYDLLFVYGALFSGFRDVPSWGFTDQLTVVDKEQAPASGQIPNFGWYQYDNGLYNGSVSPPVSLFPMANLGYIIDTMAALAGYTVNYPDPLLGRAYQADAYGVILPTMDVYNEDKAIVSGHGYGAGAGWSVTMAGGGTLNAAGLDIDSKILKRGMLNQENVAVLGFRALRPLRVTFAQSQNAVVVSGNGYDIKNDWLGAGGCDMDLETGDWFTIVNPADWSMFFGHEKWNGSIYNPHGYESAVSASFDIYESTGTPQNGSTIDFGLNLPQDMGLQDYLNAYCLLICATWSVDEAAGVINITTFDSLLQNLDFWLNLDGEKIISIDSAKRYIEGWAQHNIVRCRPADYVPEYSHFLRDYPVLNDYLDDTRDVGVIPFNEGEFTLNQWGQKAAWIDNVQQQANGDVMYRGVLSLVYENLNHDGALHLQTINDEGVGRAYGEFTQNADTFEVSVLMPLYKFLELRDDKAVTFRGASFVVESAQWGDGVAKLKLLSVNV